MSGCLVVGYDGSPTARRAVEWAMAHAGDAPVVVAHAFEPPHDWLGHPNYDRVLHEHRARGEALLEGLPDDPRIETELLAGPARRGDRPASRPLAMRTRSSSARAASAAARAALGSVSHKVLHLADRPVVVIPARRRPRRLTMTGTRSFTAEQARSVGESIGIDWASAPFDLEQFRRGMDVELEHGSHDPATDVTGDDPIVTGKIALAHLNEFADYYTRLDRMEAEAERDAADG